LVTSTPEHFEVAPIVVKLGGRALEATSPAALAAELAPFAGRVVLVHGGGAEVSTWCRRAGLEPAFADGKRVTDDATLEIAVAVLAGLANKRLVAGLSAHGVSAIGVSAVDAGIAKVVHHEDARLGRVGSIVGVDAKPLQALLASGLMPVLASIGADGETLLNLNADDLAGAVAAALGSPVLVLLSDTPGVSIDGTFASRIAAHELDAVMAREDVTGGMLPKLAAARTALAGGVQRVTIGTWNGPGSLGSLVDGTAPATVIESSTTEAVLR
jgi:acetylglutamate kinase